VKGRRRPWHPRCVQAREGGAALSPGARRRPVAASGAEEAVDPCHPLQADVEKKVLLPGQDIFDAGAEVAVAGRGAVQGQKDSPRAPASVHQEAESQSSWSPLQNQ